MTTDTRQEDELQTAPSAPTAPTPNTAAGDDMTTPTPDQYRALADDLNDVTVVADFDVETVTSAAAALRAAADHLDLLRAVVEDAPHDRDAACGFGIDPRDLLHCDCWKASAL